MSPYDLTDFEWRLIEPLLLNKPQDVPRLDAAVCQTATLGCYVPARRGVTCQGTSGTKFDVTSVGLRPHRIAHLAELSASQLRRGERRLGELQTNKIARRPLSHWPPDDRDV